MYIIFYIFDLKLRLMCCCVTFCLLPQVVPLAGAYYHAEEPLYSKLACLFGMDDIKIEEATIIVISDNTEKVKGKDLSFYDFGEEEVNSPAGLPPRSVCCKLFDDDTLVEDRESTTKTQISFIDLKSDNQVRTICDKGKALQKPPPKVQDIGGPSTRSPLGSSCGSNSPKVWWPHICRHP